MNSKNDNYQNNIEFQKSEEIINEEENKILDENIFLPVQVENYLNVINNNIILIYIICVYYRVHQSGET